MLIIKYARNVITRPTRAATIIFLADSTPALSPPDVIHLIPPNTKKARAISEAAIKAVSITAENISPVGESLHRSAKLFDALSFGQGSIISDAAEAFPAKVKYVVAVTIRADSFFMYILILRHFLIVCQELKLKGRII